MYPTRSALSLSIAILVSAAVLLSSSHGAPVTAPVELAGGDSAVSAAASRLGATMAVADAFENNVEIFVEHEFKRRVTASEIAALLPGIALGGGPDGPSALAISDSGREVFIVVHDDVGTDGVLVYNVIDDTLAHFASVEVFDRGDQFPLGAAAFFKGRLYVGTRYQGIAVFDAGNDAATRGDLLATHALPDGGQVRGLTIDAEDSALIAASKTRIYRTPVAAIGLTELGSFALDIYGVTFASHYGNVGDEGLYIITAGGGLSRVDVAGARGQSAWSPSLYYTNNLFNDIAATSSGEILASVGENAVLLSDDSDTRLGFEDFYGDEFDQLVDFCKGLVSPDGEPAGWVIDGQVRQFWNRFHPASPDGAAWVILVMLASDAVRDDTEAQGIVREILVRYGGLAADGIRPERSADGLFRHWYEPNTGGVKSGGWNPEFATFSTMLIATAADRARKYYPGDGQIVAAAEAIMQGVEWGEYIELPTNGIFLTGQQGGGHFPGADSSKPYNEALQFAEQAAWYDASTAPVYAAWLNRAALPSAELLVGSPVVGDVPDEFQPAFTNHYSNLLNRDYRNDSGWRQNVDNLWQSSMLWNDLHGAKYFTVFSAGTTKPEWSGGSGYNPDSLSHSPGTIATFPSLISFAAGGDIAPLYSAYEAYRKGARQTFTDGTTILYRRSDEDRTWTPNDAGLSDVALGALALGEILQSGLIDQVFAVPFTGSTTLSITDASGSEGDAMLPFVVELDEPIATNVVIDYVTEDGSATASQDYTAKTGQVTIPAGQANASIQIDLLEDGVFEGTEMFNVRITGISPELPFALGSDDLAVGSILENDAPANLVASDGASTSSVSVTWTGLAGAGTYSVYRSTTDVFGDAVRLASGINGSSFSDSTAAPTMIYFYWVTASKGGAEGPASNSDDGYVGLRAPSIFVPSTNLTAEIALTWTSVNGALNYQLTRSTDIDPDGGNAVDLGTFAGTSFSDTTAAIDTTYYYWIQAHGSNSISSVRIGPFNGFRPEEEDFVDVPDNKATDPTETPANYDATVTGNYWGLLYDDAAPGDRVELQGYASARISHRASTGTGTASITLFYQRVKYRLRATVAADGSLLANFARKDAGNTPMSLNLQLVDTARGGKLVGLLTGDGDTTDIDLFHREFHGSRNPATKISGRYTFVFPTDLDADHAVVPGGDGAGAGAISTSGVARLSTVLGDGTRATIVAYVGPDSELMFYRTLYRRNAAGFIGGVMDIRDVANVSAADGMLQWKKGTDVRERLYPAGFDLQQPAVASRYTPPNTRAGEFIISEFSDAESNALLSFRGGNVGIADVLKEISWTRKNKFQAVNGATISGAAATRSGLVSGLYIDRARGLKIRYRAVSFQSQGLIVGNFPGTGQSGYVRIEPNGHPSLILTRASTGAPLEHGNSISFGNIGMDAGIGEIDLRIANAGSGNLRLEAVQLVGNNAGFGLAAAHPGNVPAGEQSLLRLRFDPIDPGPQTILLRIVTNDEDHSPIELALTGTGVVGSSSIVDHAPGSGDHIDSVDASLPVEIAASVPWDAAMHGGTYQGLLLDPATANGNAGYSSLRISASRSTGLGSLSGSVMVGGKRVTLRGTMAADGTLTVSRITAGYIADVRIAETAANGPQLVGTITEVAPGKEFTLAATRHHYHARNLPADHAAGRYTMVLPANDDLGADYPGGDGYATVTIASNGRVRSSYRLGDGTRTSSASFLSADNQWPIFKSLYGRTGDGFLAGTLTLRDIAGISDFDGELDWRRPVQSKAAQFENGFQIRVIAIGSLYTPPAPGARMLAGFAAAEDNAEFILQRAGLDLTEITTWDERNRVTKTPMLSVTPNPRTGLVTGRYSNEASKVRFGGVVFQKQDLGAGMFTSGDQTGYVEFGPN